MKDLQALLAAPAAPFVLLDDSSAGGGPARLYAAPSGIIVCNRQDEIPDAFAAMERALAEGRHLAGWCAYELGYGLEPRLQRLAPPAQGPLLWFGIFDAPRLVPANVLEQALDPVRHSAARPVRLTNLNPGISRDAYIDAIQRIQDHLRAGDIYQANFTWPLGFSLDASPLALYRRLRRAQPVSFGAWIFTGRQHIMSASPELFLKKDGARLTARPMKGTAPRGDDQASDDAAAAALAADEKSRAENLMIVDLLRNDLSRIARPGSVHVPRLFAVERYRTLLQMTSEIVAEIDPALPLMDIFRALFPCGSVTGAPKIRAIEVIRSLEPAPRGVYCGAIGHVTPDRDFCFNVPIRTLTLDPGERPHEWRGVMGVGSGIVADSDAAAEYEECMLKGRFLTDPPPDFDLIETLFWSPDAGPRRLQRHLDRLAASAERFGFPFDRTAAERDIHDLAADLEPRPHRLRLLLSKSGALAVTAAPLGKSAPQPLVARLSDLAVDSGNPLLRHKTTARDLHAAAFVRAQPCFDVILRNERGELTEGSFTNLFVERDGLLLTPPVSSGLLPGVLRAELLEGGQAREQVLHVEDLDDADAVYLGNSLRGLLRVTVDLSPARR